MTTQMNKLAILCVDDEPTMLASLEVELKRALDDEYFIEVAEDAQEALAIIDELWHEGYQIPIVIADYIMPGMKGDELLRRIHAISPKTLKIMLTGQATIEAMGYAVQYANLYRYIAKPLEATDFHLTIKEALHSYFQARKLEDFYAQLEAKVTQRTQELHKKNLQLMQEISDRQRVEAALRKSEEQYRLLVARLPNIAVSLFDHNLRFLLVDGEEIAKSGFDRALIEGKTLAEAYPPEIVQLFEPLYKKALNGDCISFEHQFGEFVYHQQILPIQHNNGEIYGGMVVSHNITEQKQAEETLKKANEMLHRLATMDGLTQIANRRRFDSYLAEVWQQTCHTSQPLSLILCDIDYFKRYNDYYGHQSGDDTLTRVAQAINQAVRLDEYLVARYGGEEFAIILPDIDCSTAIQVAKAIQFEIARLQIDHEKSDVSNYITVSMGLATVFPTKTLPLETLFERADQALYKAKAQGRNRLMIDRAE